MEVLKPSPQILIKLGSLFVHAQELLSANGHNLDRVSIESLLSDKELNEWITEMDKLALVPKKR